MSWQWRSVQTDSDIAFYLKIIHAHQPQYAPTTRQLLRWHLARRYMGKLYWIARDDLGNAICYLLWLPPGRRHRPVVQQIGALASDSWIKLFLRAPALIFAHISSQTPHLEKRLQRRIDRLFIAPIDPHDGRALVRRVARLPGAKAIDCDGLVAHMIPLTDHDPSYI